MDAELYLFEHSFYSIIHWNMKDTHSCDFTYIPLIFPILFEGEYQKLILYGFDNSSLHKHDPFRSSSTVVFL